MLAEAPGHVGVMLQHVLGTDLGITAHIDAGRIETGRDLVQILDLRHVPFGIGQQLVGDHMQQDQLGA